MYASGLVSGNVSIVFLFFPRKIFFSPKTKPTSLLFNPDCRRPRRLLAHRRPVQEWLEMERFAAKFTFSISENFRYLLDMCIFNNLVKRNFFFTRQIPRNIFILRSTNSFKNFSFLLLLFFLIHRFD